MPGEIKINEQKKVEFSDLEKYRDLIMEDYIDDEELLNGIPEFWMNAIQTCWAYKQIKQKNYKQAMIIMEKVTNELKQQIVIWSKRYCKNFFEFYNENMVLINATKIKNKTNI